LCLLVHPVVTNKEDLFADGWILVRLDRVSYKH
jgi:hypothetical protein